MKICSVEECAREVCAKGLCEPHYRRMRRLGSPTDGTWFRTTQVEVCGVVWCSSPGYAKGYCQRHYQRHAKYGNAEEPPRQTGRTGRNLDVKVMEGIPTGLPDTECWEWTKTRNREGYGVVPHGGRHLLAHRIVYGLANGTKIPKGRVIRHKCDNPPCVNPSHLEIGTHADNTKDKMDRGRHLVGESITTAKLTEVEVLSIRKMHADGTTTTALAKEFGVSTSNVCAIIRRSTWKHI